MTSSTLTLTPGPSDLDRPGVGAAVELPPDHPLRHRSDLGIQAGLLARAADPGYGAWLAHVMPAAACSRPIRLRVEAEWPDSAGQPLVDPVSSTMPDRVLYVACKNRRAAVCPSCSSTYRADMYQLIKAGLVGGKGVPASVAEHPCLFLTLTAPSFGPVHSAGKPGQRRLCHPRRSPEVCRHGMELACWAVHDRDDRRVGEPLCRDCYDYQHQAAWNIHAGELWRRTSIALNRAMTRLARARGAQVRLSYAKVAEYQHRGVVHFHALIRLDGRDPTDPTAVLAPHPSITIAHLESAIRDAVEVTAFITEAHPRHPDGWPIEWGQQLDIRRVQLAATDLADDGQITTTAVAAYLAKYATKATEEAGHTSGPAGAAHQDPPLEPHRAAAGALPLRPRRASPAAAGGEQRWPWAALAAGGLRVWHGVGDTHGAEEPDAFVGEALR